MPFNKVYAALLVAAASSPVFAIERDRAEEYCQKPELSKALRQTIVLLDERVVIAQQGDDIPASNRDLIRLFLNFADPEKARRSNTFVPRERFTVYALPRDGSEPRHVFTGCQPFYSEEEIAQIESAKGSIARYSDTYFGKGTIAEAKKYEGLFRNVLTSTLIDAGKSATMVIRPSDSPGFLDSSLIVSLQRAPRLVNLHDGVPRIILLSDFSPFSMEGMANLVDARTRGFSLAKQANIDFSRSELYAVAISTVQQNKLSREFAHAFFLGSGALLTGWSNKAISNLLTNANTIRVFQGFIDYGNMKAPIQVRLAWDRNGTLVNSWISLATKNTVSTPMSGAAVCEEPTKCSIKSDDSGFAQVWSTNPDEKAEYDASMPFSGLRRFEIDLSGAKAHGKIWDPAVVQVGEKKDLPFDLTEVKDGVF